MGIREGNGGDGLIWLARCFCAEGNRWPGSGLELGLFFGIGNESGIPPVFKTEK